MISRCSFTGMASLVIWSVLPRFSLF